MECNCEAPYAQLAVQFARALTDGNFALAHTLLLPELSADLTPARLRETYEAMIEYGDGPPTNVELIVTMEQWQLPEQRLTDLGWAYVAIAGDGYSEAVTVIVEDAGDGPAIRYLEWGRP
ncbi:MAG: hypothetical protein KME14_04515 [Tildeniella torsiva UHER 1998/13D]|jgi:hypothetical protein|nr:hypothetical protein [Tildeniella torsiva UHER 1998/13D]